MQGLGLGIVLLSAGALTGGCCGNQLQRHRHYLVGAQGEHWEDVGTEET